MKITFGIYAHKKSAHDDYLSNDSLRNELSSIRQMRALYRNKSFMSI